jgi:hypothetical protein
MIHCIIYHYLCILVDLWDFPTKSLSLIFNFWEAENLLFRIFAVLGPSRCLKIKEKYLISFSSRERPWAQEALEGSHEAQNRLGGRTTQARFGLERRLGSSFL